MSFVRLLFCLIFVIPGYIMIFPLSFTIGNYSEYQRIKSLKGSTVKVKANDVLASTKIIAYICTYPLYLTLFTIIFRYFVYWFFEYEKAFCNYLTSIFFIAFPILQMISIRSHDGVKTHFREFHGRLMTLFYRNQV
jgi:glycerol-3-phosphate O-acyltransferase/dihydroxyacetone phosphate acyltransferase